MSSTFPQPEHRITHALPDLHAWTECFRTAEIPVLARTSEALDALRAVEDQVDANSLGEMISGDPLMTLKLLAFVAANRSRRTVTDTETVTAALVMIGIPPFFKAFGPQPTVEDRLADMSQALAGLSDALHRAHRAATFALGFAVHRMDPDVALIHNAALLHDFAEMLLWCHAPTLALKIRQAQLDNPSLRSSVAQRQVLNIELADLQQALMKAWRLPELLIRISDDRHADQTNVKCVSLALRLARHTAQDWDNPAIPDDVNEISQLLNLSQAATLTLLRDI
jgi:HD-like signal output (HDOD) protein